MLASSAAGQESQGIGNSLRYPDAVSVAFCPLAIGTQAHVELLRPGADIEMLEPAELRDRMAETARELAAIYR
jgi:predicted DNA-binding transcriptional regulator YafY